MAHIPDGVLSLPVLAAGGIVAVSALGISLRRLGHDDIPRTAVLSASFFVASLIAVPIGPGSIHPLLNGLMGLVLGWAAVPAIAVSMILQMVFFGFGGLTALGINIVNVSLPAILVAYTVRPWLRRRTDRRSATVAGAAAAAIGVAGTGLLVALSLALSDPAYLAASRVIALTYLPLLIVEAAITAAVAGFLARVAPEMLGREP